MDKATYGVTEQIKHPTSNVKCHRSKVKCPTLKVKHLNFSFSAIAAVDPRIENHAIRVESCVEVQGHVGIIRSVLKIQGKPYEHTMGIFQSCWDLTMWTIDFSSVDYSQSMDKTLFLCNLYGWHWAWKISKNIVCNNWLLELQPPVILQNWLKSNFSKVECDLQIHKPVKILRSSIHHNTVEYR